jgi:hypothetical protein
METTPQIPNAEQRMVEEHFNRELEIASQYAPLTELPHRRATNMEEEMMVP